jgi:ParB/Sulfiredoxin domain
MAKKATISRTPNDIALALAEAERELKPPPDGKQQTVQIRPAQISTRPELFQPRGFSNSALLDNEHVKKLARRIDIKGELDPPLVVKLGKKWVCVDGHHRIAAYLKQPDGYYLHNFITCDWFAGSVRDAVNESVRRNDVAKLEMRRGDKYEAAWQRVVLDWGSKKEIVNITGVSGGLVAAMRRVVKAYERKDTFGRELKAEMRGKLEDCTWSAARNAYNNITPAEWDPREAGAKLSKNLRNRMHGKLSDNPIVTA